FRDRAPDLVTAGVPLQALLEPLLHLVAGKRRLQVVRLLVDGPAETGQHEALTVHRDFEIMGQLETADDVDRLAIETGTDHVLAVGGKVVADQDSAAGADRE